ncbi:MAG: ion channel [Verrucomicrobiota bacterium]
MKPGSFSDAFFFSVETLATVGYGHMYPQTVYGHIVSTAEIITGMFGMAVTTGIIFVRFSRPSARFEFSRCVVVGQFDGGPSLMLRIANLRPQAMVNAEFRIVLIRKEVTREGVPFHQYHPLSLAMDRAILFPAVVTLRHVIDERSPLRGVTAEQLAESHSRLLVLVTCVDTVIPSPVESQKAYTWHDVLYGHRFVQIYRDIEDELLEVDYARIHETEPDSLPQPPP